MALKITSVLRILETFTCIHITIPKFNLNFIGELQKFKPTLIYFRIFQEY